MEIKCTLHPENKAILVCEHCSFLCREHLGEHKQNAHPFVMINKNIALLYNAMAQQTQAHAILLLITRIKQEIDHKLDRHSYANGLLYKNAQKEMDACQSAIYGIGHKILKEHIQKSINPKINDLNNYIQKIMTDLGKIVNSIIASQFTHKESLFSESNSQNHSETNVIHYWEGKDITIYDPISKKKSMICLNKSINYNADSISYGNRIFILGGYIINDVYEVDVEHHFLKNRSPMQYKKYQHSLCQSHKCIFSIGGFDGTKCISDCEKYSIDKDDWITIPDIEIPRAASAIFVFHNKYIYCFGGYGNSIFLNSIERLNLSYMVKWEGVFVANPPSERYSFHGIQINYEQAIVFGGYMEKLLCDSYVLSIADDKVECMRGADLECAGSFYCSSCPVLVNGTVYGVDNDTNFIHTFENGKWRVIK